MLQWLRTEQPRLDEAGLPNPHPTWHSVEIGTLTLDHHRFFWDHPSGETNYRIVTSPQTGKLYVHIPDLTIAIEFKLTFG